MQFAAMRIASLISAVAVLKEVGGIEVVFPYSFIVKGEPYTILWSPMEASVSHVCYAPMNVELNFVKKQNTTIELLRGYASNLISVAVLGTTTEGSFQWIPSDSLPSANNYDIKVSQDSAYNYSMQFGITDEASALANASTTSLLSSATTPPSPTSSPKTTEPEFSAPQKGLNTGQIAGIGVGAAIAGLVLAVVAFFVGRTLRRKSKPAAPIVESWTAGDKPELDSKSLYPIKVACEMDAKAEIRELHSDAVMGEADAKNALYELASPQELHAHSCQKKLDS